jgi:hypothetical protein
VRSGVLLLCTARLAAGQLALQPKTTSRETTMHLRMSPLEFVPLPIERPLSGGSIRWSYVGSGSSCASQIS